MTKLENHRAKYRLTLQIYSSGMPWNKEINFTRRDSLTCKNSTLFACYKTPGSTSHTHPLRLSPTIPSSVVKPPVKVMEVKD